jgi:hypothetical protein
VTDPTLTISIDRSGMPGALEPLVFSGAVDATPLGIYDYQEPARQMRVTYAPDSADIHGSEATGAALQQAVLGWDWAADHATSETDVQAAYDEVAAAISQFSYLVTTQVSGAPARVWSADPGSLIPSPRDYSDLSDPTTHVYSVSLPVFPIPGSVGP